MVPSTISILNYGQTRAYIWYMNGDITNKGYVPNYVFCVYQIFKCASSRLFRWADSINWVFRIEKFKPTSSYFPITPRLKPRFWNKDPLLCIASYPFLQQHDTTRQNTPHKTQRQYSFDSDKTVNVLRARYVRKHSSTNCTVTYAPSCNSRTQTCIYPQNVFDS